jgi:recombination protein RecA
VIEYYGLEAGGKTTMALHAVANCQAAGGRAAFIDAEHALDPELARNLKVDLPNLYLVQPDYGEQALDIACSLVESGAFAIIVLDSVAALVPKAELDGEMGDQQMGLQARMMGKALRKLTSITHTTNTCFIFINQLREKIGTFGYGDKNTTPGGKALKFYSSVRLDIRRIGSVKRGDDIIGNQIKIKVVKNKLAPPYKEIETELIFGKGINKFQEMLNIGVEKEIITKDGHSFVYNEEKIGGRDKFFEYLQKLHPIQKVEFPIL